MGYTTEFRGHFKSDKPFKEEHIAYINTFAETRRMKRNPKIAEKLDDPIRKAVELPIGKEGEYFVGGLGCYGQDCDKSVVDDYPPKTQPGLWCQWIIPEEDNSIIEWDGNEKFYCYIEWLEYLIQHFIKPWGYTLNGTVEWRGEEWGDAGSIIVKDNKITIENK